MQAAQRNDKSEVHLVELSAPEAADGEVVIDVIYAGVNPFDMQVLRGQIGDPTATLTLGAEATGRLDGKLVHVSGGGLGAVRPGTYADQVVVPMASVIPVPDGVDAREAATVGIAGKTAFRAVHQLGEVGSEDTVLVLGATGGVGTFAAQLAARTGARVLAHTSSSSKAMTLGSRGVEVLEASGPAAVRDEVADKAVTVVLDPLGGDYMSSLLDVVAPSARFVTYGVLAGTQTTVDLTTLYGRGLRIFGTSGGTTPPDQARSALTGAMEAVAAGEVTIPTEVLPLCEVRSAFDRLAARGVAGKLLLEPGSA
jgi:NADPH2:quinone reductase